MVQVDDDQRVVSFVQAELHLRVESAAQALWDVVDGREAAALREVEALRGDGWVQHSQQALAKRFAALMKIEVRVCVAHRVVCRVLRIVYCTVLYCTVLYCTVLSLVPWPR